MTFRSTFSLIPFLLFISACGSTSQFSSPKLESPLTIDGALSDWSTSESLLDEREDANFYTTHDDDFLYIYVDIRSPFRDRSIRQSGFIIYLSDNQEMRKRIGLGFPTGSFNLLRDNPGQYNSFLTDNEWMGKPENTELIDSLEDEIFERAMIVQRQDGRTNPEHGFVEISQLEVDGIEIAVDEQRRYLSLEVKIPRDGSSLFEFSGDEVWLGFAVETPNFRIPEQSEYSATVQNRNQGMYGNNRQRAPQRQNIARNLGEFEQWYKLDLN